MKEKTVYEAEDGTLHDTEDECVVHERITMMTAKLNKIAKRIYEVDKGCSESRYYNSDMGACCLSDDHEITNFIIENADDIIAALIVDGIVIVNAKNAKKSNLRK